MQQQRPAPAHEWSSAARLRRALADRLRGLAGRIDGRWTIAIRLPRDLALTDAQLREAVGRGLEVIRTGIDSAVQENRMELELRRRFPHLWP